MFFQLPYEEKVKIKLTPASGYRFVVEDRTLFLTQLNSQMNHSVNIINKPTCIWNFMFRGYQRVGENITKGVPDMHEAIDVSLSSSFERVVHITFHVIVEVIHSCIWLQCYREFKPGTYGTLGKTMEGSNQW